MLCDEILDMRGVTGNGSLINTDEIGGSGVSFVFMRTRPLLTQLTRGTPTMIEIKALESCLIQERSTEVEPEISNRVGVVS